MIAGPRICRELVAGKQSHSPTWKSVNQAPQSCRTLRKTVVRARIDELIALGLENLQLR